MRHALFFSLLISVCTLRGQNYEDRINREVVIGDTTQTHQVILRDYSRLRGTVTEVRSDSFFLKVASVPESLAIPTDALRHLGLYRPERSPELVSPRPAREIADLDDLTLVRTALPFATDRRFQTVMLAYNAIEWRFGEHFEIGTGIAGPLGVLFNQRYRTSLTPYLHVGLSNELLLFPLIGSSADFPVVGDLTTLLTVGNATQFFNAGVGLFYGGGGNDGPTYNYRVGAGVRVSRRVHLYGEMLGYFDPFDGFGLLPSLNVAVAKRRHRWSYGIMSVFLDSEFNPAVPIPYISYTVYH
ncbi:hypothetical protein CLV84_2687 [Neolewinella xylanilytica]|uniref:Uncharacterized protein n=1 Tax=Neolewinella xylanilytica TaxID=1514080 RepID=A0A2S6I3P0_9BACT|nr:hypothetical protein [Neolewinella xylanilytica]PPK85780.1 hypothetical protein CLV84_2687 [Neolewinella xylanilytica]